MNFDNINNRYLAAAFCIVLYLMLCGWVVWREWKKRRLAAKAAAALTPAMAGTSSWLVAYASQTGNAEQLAWQTARALHTTGIPARISPLSQLNADDLQQCERALFITSTYGEGDPPDNATLFARKIMSTSLNLSQLHYGVLALGDREYRNFCGFGRNLDAWLQAQGGQSLFPRIDVSNSDAAALEQWRHQLSHVAGTDDLPDWQAPAYEHWRLAARQHLNPGSAGNPVFHIELERQPGKPLPAWQAGDLVQILAPADRERPREYSIASIPGDGRIHLLVRQERHEDGTLGVASGWLSAQAELNAQIELRIHQHQNFRLEGNAGRPLILIGNGTGLAGLRAHLKARIEQQVSRNWLIFGERNAAHDAYYQDELAAWQAQGMLRVDRVFSRDQPERRYVQDQLRDAANTVLEWINNDAAIYVCGSLEGMASSVEATLVDIIGTEGVERLIEAGRYRRDVY